MMKAHLIRNLFRNFKYTILHPQWIVFRYQKDNYIDTGKVVQGVCLDIGCGGKTLQSYVKNVSYIGLDYPITGNSFYKSSPDIFGDGQNLPFKDSSIDTTIILDVLEHLPDPCKAVGEAVRVTKQGGVIVISTPFLYPIHDAPYDYQRWTKHGLEMLIKNYSIKVVKFWKHGSLIETSCLLSNIAISWTALYSSPIIRVPFLLFAIFIIPMLNIVAFISRYALKQVEDDPYAIGYTYILRKK